MEAVFGVRIFGCDDDGEHKRFGGNFDRGAEDLAGILPLNAILVPTVDLFPQNIVPIPLVHRPGRRRPLRILSNSNNMPAMKTHPMVAIQPYFDIMAAYFQYSFWFSNDGPPTLLPVLTVRCMH